MEQCISHCVYASVRFVFFSFLLTHAQSLFSSLSFLLHGLAGVPFFSSYFVVGMIFMCVIKSVVNPKDISFYFQLK